MKKFVSEMLRENEDKCFKLTSETYGFSPDINTDISVVKISICRDKQNVIKRFVVEVCEDCSHFINFTKGMINMCIEELKETDCNTTYFSYDFDRQMDQIVTITACGLGDDAMKFAKALSERCVNLAIVYYETKISTKRYESERFNTNKPSVSDRTYAITI